MPRIKIRFNTAYGTESDLPWRVLVNDTEYLASAVHIHTPTYTSADVLPDGRLKHHISTEGAVLEWQGNTLTIK